MRSNKIVDKQGYILIYRPNHHKTRTIGYVLEHRIIYEEYYNCCLLDFVDIHHKDGNKQNNNINNLIPILHTKHTILERTKDMSNRFCLICGSNKTRMDNNRPHWYKFEDGFMCNNCRQWIKNNI